MEMISSELAKELKDAGFPQKHGALGGPFMQTSAGEEILIPILEELIEACGDGFAWLHRSRKNEPVKFAAQDFVYDEDDGPSGGQGATAAEAVARLWLALKKNI